MENISIDSRRPEKKINSPWEDEPVVNWIVNLEAINAHVDFYPVDLAIQTSFMAASDAMNINFNFNGYSYVGTCFINYLILPNSIMP